MLRVVIVERRRRWQSPGHAVRIDRIAGPEPEVRLLISSESEDAKRLITRLGITRVDESKTNRRVWRGCRLECPHFTRLASRLFHESIVIARRGPEIGHVNLDDEIIRRIGARFDRMKNARKGIVSRNLQTYRAAAGHARPHNRCRVRHISAGDALGKCCRRGFARCKQYHAYEAHNSGSHMTHQNPPMNLTSASNRC